MRRTKPASAAASVNGFVTVSATWSNTAGALPNNRDFGLIVLQDQRFASGFNAEFTAMLKAASADATGNC